MGSPEFGRKAKLDVKLLSLLGDSEARGSGGNSGRSTNLQDSKTPSSESNVLRLSIPLADGNPNSRVYAYDVVAVGEDPKAKLFKSVYFEGANAGIGHEPQGGVTTLDIPRTELPDGRTLVIAVRPVSSLGTKGRAIAAKYAFPPESRQKRI